MINTFTLSDNIFNLKYDLSSFNFDKLLSAILIFIDISNNILNLNMFFNFCKVNEFFNFGVYKKFIFLFHFSTI